MSKKRFTVIYNEHCEMMQYVDNQKEEPNKWAIWNARETARKLNDLNDKNEQLQKKLIYLIENGLKELFGEKYRIIEVAGDWND